jgi:hypothetical protein
LSLKIVRIGQVQSLLEDIKDVRWDKVEKGLKNLSGRTHAVKVITLYTEHCTLLGYGAIVFMFGAG